MTYVVTDACVRCKFTDCVEVCPVDAFHEGELMLVINPDVCIDCGVCEPECPVEAISPDTVAEDKWVEVNRNHAARWPVLAEKKDALDDANEYRDEKGKYEKYLQRVDA